MPVIRSLRRRRSRRGRRMTGHPRASASCPSRSSIPGMRAQFAALLLAASGSDVLAGAEGLGQQAPTLTTSCKWPSPAGGFDLSSLSGTQFAAVDVREPTKSYFFSLCGAFPRRFTGMGGERATRGAPSLPLRSFASPNAPLTAPPPLPPHSTPKSTRVCAGLNPAIPGLPGTQYFPAKGVSTGQPQAAWQLDTAQNPDFAFSLGWDARNGWLFNFSGASSRCTALSKFCISITPGSIATSRYAPPAITLSPPAHHPFRYIQAGARRRSQVPRWQ